MDPNAPFVSEVQHDFVKSCLGSFRILDTTSSRSLRAADWLSRGLCIIALCILLQNPDRAVVLERPTQSSVLGLLGAGAALVGIAFLARTPATTAKLEEQIPLTDNDDEPSGRPRASSLLVVEKLPWNHQYLRLGLTAVAIMLRLECFESVLRNMQCGIAGVEAFLPVLTALMDWGVNRASRTPGSDNISPMQRLLRSMGPAFVVAWANNLTWQVASHPRSSVICPATPGISRWVVQMQFLGVILDAGILHSIQSLLGSLPSRVSNPAKRSPLLLGVLFMLSSGMIFSVGSLTAVFPQYRAVLSNLNRHYERNLLWETVVFTVLCLCGSHWVAVHTSTDLAVALSFFSSGVQIWSAWANAANSPAPHLYLTSMPPFLLLSFGIMLYIYFTRKNFLWDSDSRSRYYRLFLFLFGGIVLCTTIFRGLMQSTESSFFSTHPIDTLIYRAQQQHQAWSEQASRSSNLQQAVDTYVNRYARHPPPGFDKWFRYALKRKAFVIDDFDNIDQNLQIFWKMEPRWLRMNLKQLLSDASNECAEVSIRNGEATVGNVIPTHRWMVEGIIHMMEPFVKDLPDMDLAFNINDEPRVAVPHKALEILERVQIEQEGEHLKNSWPVNSTVSWQIPEGEVIEPTRMRVMSFRRIWRLFGAVACPPDSPAWTSHFWDSTVTCTWCYEPHSYHHFLSNWTLAASPCHQPDLANLHGFYLSPSAFNPTYEVLPIFSQSRAGGFADILYPTAWNYNDKVKLDPSDQFPDDEIEKKENTLFWHGSATEGYSRTGVWRGQTRQRIVQLANNSTVKSNILLPDGSGYRYSHLSTKEFTQHPSIRETNFSTAIGFVGMFPRCDNGDCEAQEEAFGLQNATDFQEHWRHRFLLDADGAGFSGRFLPFLQSHSLPFKSAIFREWYDDRLTAWKHFVPVDVRLHNLWSTVAYFAAKFGLRSRVLNGVDPGKQIAEDGRAWAAKVLRKEDMEIYFYRLLLEYARVMDDDRANLGYSWRVHGE